MKKLFLLIILLSGLFSCKKENMEKELSVFLINDFEESSLLVSGQELVLSMFDTLTIEIQKTTDFLNINGPNTININKMKDYDNRYKIWSTTYTNDIPIIVLSYCSNEFSEMKYFYLYIPISIYFLRYEIYEHNIEIKVENRNLCEEIEREIEDYTGGYYKLDYLTYEIPRKGLLQFGKRIFGGIETIEGTFSEEIIDDAHYLILSYNDEVCYYLVEEDNRNNHVYYLTEELTEKYQHKYPDEKIDKVQIKISVLKQYEFPENN